MSLQQPTLEELGLDAPATKPFGNAFDNYDSSKDEQPKTWVDAIKVDVPTKSGVAAVLSFLIPGLGQIFRGRIASGVLSVIAFSALYFIAFGFLPLALLVIPAHIVNIYLAYDS